LGKLGYPQGFKKSNKKISDSKAFSQQLQCLISTVEKRVSNISVRIPTTNFVETELVL